MTTHTDTVAEAVEDVEANEGIQQAGVQAMLRFFLVTSRGRFVTFMAIPGVRPNSLVMVSMTEVGSNKVPFLGSRACTVHNVVPENNGVRFRGFIDHGTDITVRLAVFVA